jgi:hypothetical protein
VNGEAEDIALLPKCVQRLADPTTFGEEKNG